MKLKRGNPKSLEGRTLIYVRNLKADKNSPRFPAFYCSTSLIDLFLLHEENRSLSNLDEIKAKIEKADLNATKKFRDAIGSETYTPLISAPLSIGRPEDALEFEGDIVFGGRAESIGLSRSLLESTHTCYSINYNAQKFREMQVLKSQPSVKSAPPNPREDYKNYSPEDLRRRMTELTGQMFYAQESNDEFLKARTLIPLHELSRGAPFAREVGSLIKVITSYHPRRTDLATAYIHLIHALSEERYEKALDLKKQIDSLTAQE